MRTKKRKLSRRGGWIDMLGALTTVSLTLALDGCAHKPSENLLLEWTDGATQTRIYVVERPTLVKRNAHLCVARSGKVLERMIDDDMCFGTISFLRHGQWFLVLNDQYAVAGYNFGDGRLYGEYDWRLLPFTIRKSSGDILTTRKVGIIALPANFPLVEEK